MPSILLSDNGVSSGSAGFKTTAASDGSLALQTTTAGGTATTAVTIDTSQNVGVGVTPSAWSTGKAMQIGSGAADLSLFCNNNDSNISSNAYYNGGWKYQWSTAVPASRYQQTNGAHQWYNAPSGTAGNAITFTQAMTLFASGGLALGTTSDPTSGYFAIGPDSGKTSNSLMWLSNTGGRLYIGKESSAGGTIINGTSAYAAVIATNNAYPLQFGTNNATGMTLDASGNLLVGSTSAGYSASGRGVIELNGSSSSLLAFRIGSTNKSYIFQDGTNFNFASSITGGALTFLTQDTERARIDSSGNLLVGTTSPGITNTNSISIQPTRDANGDIIINHATGAANGQNYLIFGYGGSLIGSVTQSGTTAVLYNVTSDQRLKENIVDAPEFGSVIDSIQVRSYDWKTDQTHQRYGFIAQELVTVAPEAVHQPANPEEMMAVDYSKLVPMLVKEIQSLRKRLAAAGI